MLIIDSNKKMPLYEQIFIQIRKTILSGEWETDRKLEPIRILATRLGVSRNTVNKAYQQLLSEGYIRAIQGSGYYVEPLALPVQQENFSSFSEARKPGNPNRIKYDFSYEKFESTAFPWNKWRHYLQQAITENSYSDTIDYECAQGSKGLREKICEYIQRVRGIQCEPEQIILCPGTQNAMEILLNILQRKKVKAAFEEPGYDGMRQIFLNHKYQIETIPMTAQGIDVNYLETTDCNLLYTCPSHQFPLGVTMSLDKRLQILQWCHRNNAIVVENDYDNEFISGTSMLPSIQSMDENEEVVYLSTLTKVLSPEIRCAFMILPYPILELYRKQYSLHYSFFSIYEQRALTDFINDGILERQMRKMQTLNRRKKDVILQVLKNTLPYSVECSEKYSGGSHLVLRIHSSLSQEELISRLNAYGIRLYGTERYWYTKKQADPQLFLLGYNSIPLDRVRIAAEAFTSAIKEILNTDR